LVDWESGSDQSAFKGGEDLFGEITQGPAEVVSGVDCAREGAAEEAFVVVGGEKEEEG
jgi:hypothetical protein